MRASELNRPDIRAARVRWVEMADQVVHKHLLFIDESGAKTNMTRLYGRAPRGTRVYDHVPNGRWETTTMIAAIGRDGVQAPWILDGPMDGEAFSVWVECILAPTLKKGDIVVMDNLSVHKNNKACEAIAAKGALVWYLSAYSPDLNPIEKMWSKTKAYLRKIKARTPESLYEAIGQAMSQVSCTDIKNWFAPCGYSLI